MSGMRRVLQLIPTWLLSLLVGILCALLPSMLIAFMNALGMSGEGLKSLDGDGSSSAHDSLVDSSKDLKNEFNIGNTRFMHRVPEDFAIGLSSIHGRGVFTTRDYKADEWVGVQFISDPTTFHLTVTFDPPECNFDPG